MTATIADTDAVSDAVLHAVRSVKAGRPVVVVDDVLGTGTGNIVFAAEHATADLLAFTVRHTAGFVTVAMTPELGDQLDLPVLRSGLLGLDTDHDPGTGYAVTVDATDDVGTGISAADRAVSIRLIADPTTRPHQLTRPGHLVTVRTRRGGVLAHGGVAEAAVDLAYLAGGQPVGVLSALVSVEDPTELCRGAEVGQFADRHDLPVVSVADLAAYRRSIEQVVVRVGQARIPLRHGQFTAIGYRSVGDEREHIAFVLGSPSSWSMECVRILRECLLGHAFGSVYCDCRRRLDTAFDDIAAAGQGAIIYVRARQAASAGMMTLLAGYGDAAVGSQLCGPLSVEEQRTADQILLDLRGADSF